MAIAALQAEISTMMSPLLARTSVRRKASRIAKNSSGAARALTSSITILLIRSSLIVSSGRSHAPTIAPSTIARRMRAINGMRKARKSSMS